MIDADIICELLEKLVGPTTPIGETNFDNEAYANLEKLIVVSDWCIERLIKAANFRHRHEWSMQSLGNNAYGELNYIEAQIEEVEDE